MIEINLLKRLSKIFIFIFRLLSLWHECVPEVVTVDGVKKIFFAGPSPDETTLVDFAQK